MPPSWPCIQTLFVIFFAKKQNFLQTRLLNYVVLSSHISGRCQQRQFYKNQNVNPNQEKTDSQNGNVPYPLTIFPNSYMLDTP